MAYSRRMTVSKVQFELAQSRRKASRTRKTPQARGAQCEHNPKVPSAISVQQDEDGGSPTEGQGVPQREGRRLVSAQACYGGLGSHDY